MSSALYETAKTTADLTVKALSVLTGETIREVSQSTKRASWTPPRIFECGSTARGTWVPGLVAGRSKGDIDVTVDFCDSNYKPAFDSLVPRLAEPCRTWKALFLRPGMTLADVTVTDEAKKRPDRYRAYQRVRYFVHPYDIDVEVHVCIWGGLTYTDVFDAQARQIMQLGGPAAMQSVLTGIHAAKHLFAQAGLYKTELNHAAVPGVGIEQLIIQTGRMGNNPLIIRTVPTLREALTWILRRTEVLGTENGEFLPKIPDLDICHVPGICELGSVNFFQRLTVDGWKKLRQVAAEAVTCS
jgi:hypothetical protein